MDVARPANALAGNIPAAAPFSQPQTSRGLVVAVTVLAVLAGIAGLSAAHGLLTPMCFAILIAFALRPAVEATTRLGVPRALSALVWLSVAVTLFAFMFSQMQDSAQALIESFPQQLREAARRIGLRPADIESAVPLKAMLWAGALGGVAIAATWASVLLLAYFLLSTGDLLRRRLVAAAGPDAARRARFASLLDEIETTANRYLILIVNTNVLLGLATWAAFHAIGVANAGAWGLLAALAHFVPYVGPAFIALASTVAGTAQFDSVTVGLWIGACSLAIAAVVGVVLATWLAGRAARMNVLAVFATVFFWGWLWGIAGLFLGTPIMLALKVVAARSTRLSWLHEALRDDRSPSADRKLPRIHIPRVRL